MLELWRRIVFNLALSVAKMYGLSAVRALEELQEIKNVVESNWSDIFANDRFTVTKRVLNLPKQNICTIILLL